MRNLILIATASFLIPVASQAASLEDLLVEKGIITKSEARASMGSGAKVYWNKGTRFEFPDHGFTAKINTQVQARYQYIDADDDVEDAVDEDLDASTFDIRRARITLSGTALNNEFEYKVQGDFVGTTDAGAGDSIANLKDAWIQWNACDWGSVRMGQFKNLVSRQESNSSAALQFPDRSIASEFFSLGRANGAQFSVVPGEGWTITGQIFNGESDGEGSNRDGQDTDHTFVAAVRGNLMGEMDPFEEGDVGMTQDTAVNVGAAYSASKNNNDDGLGATVENDVTRLSADVNVKSDGFSFHGEYFYGEIDPDAASDDVNPSGFYAQAGYMLNENWEVAGRYSYVDCDDSVVVSGDLYCIADNISAWGGSVNYYWWKHHLKAQLGYEHEVNDFGDDDNDIKSNRWILQLSAYV